MADGPQPPFLQRTAGRDLRRQAAAARRFHAASAFRHHGGRRPLHTAAGHPPHRRALPAPAVGTVRPGGGGLLRRRQRLHRQAPAPPAGGVPDATLPARPLGTGGLPHPRQGVLPDAFVRPGHTAHLSSTPRTPGERPRKAPVADAPLPFLGPHRQPRTERTRRRPPALRQRQLRREPAHPQEPGQQRLGRRRRALGGEPCAPVQRHAPADDHARSLVSESPADRHRFRRDSGLRGGGRVAAGLSPRLRRTQPGHGVGIRGRLVR